MRKHCFIYTLQNNNLYNQTAEKIHTTDPNPQTVTKYNIAIYFRGNVLLA